MGAAMESAVQQRANPLGCIVALLVVGLVVIAGAIIAIIAAATGN